MQNLTIAVDDSLLRCAQDYVVKHGTTLDRVIQAYLVELTGFEDLRLVNQLEKSEPQEKNGPMRVLKMSESNTPLSFKALEEADFSPVTLSAEDDSSPFDTSELSPQQLDQKIAEMFTQALQRKKGR